jgi:hypothetical protein
MKLLIKQIHNCLFLLIASEYILLTFTFVLVFINFNKKPLFIEKQKCNKLEIKKKELLRTAIK